jgi:hypothetical protein
VGKNWRLRVTTYIHIGARPEAFFFFVSGGELALRPRCRRAFPLMSCQSVRISVGFLKDLIFKRILDTTC